MGKRYIQIVWTPPVFPMDEKFDWAKFKLAHEDGFLKLRTAEGELVRIFPAHAVQLVQFGEIKDEPLAVSPSPAPGPRAVDPAENTTDEIPAEDVPAHLPLPKPFQES